MNRPSAFLPDDELAQMVGHSAAFRDIKSLLRKIAGYDAAVLIEGETGTGKELAARAVHYLSRRRSMPFVPVNCGALPDTLLENELFGHREGAFTGANGARQGLIAQAEGGTLFLDEIDTLSSKAQVTLLRFMQDQTYRPLGCAQAKSGDVRVVAASNADLAERSKTGEFRADLLFRLRILSVEMPPLRIRHGDVELLTQHYLERLSRKYGKPVKPLHPDTLAWMNSYDWPGNVRELEHLLHREFLLGDEPIIALCCERRRMQPDRRIVDIEVGFRTAKAQAIADFEKRFLEHVLALTDGNVTHAAERAGMERRALGKLIKKHGLGRYQLPGDP